MSIDWTPALIETLTQLWTEGLQTVEIGRRMNLSKNAVVGKAHRIGLPARPSPIKRKTPSARPVRAALPLADMRAPLPQRRNEIIFGQKLPDRTSAPLPGASKVPAASPRRAGVSSLNSAPVPVQPKDGTGVPFGGARADQCAWPLWDDDTPRDAQRVCGCTPAQREDGTRLPYCVGHATAAYTKPRSRAEAA